MATIEVRVTRSGVARGNDVTFDDSTVAHCTLCDRDADLVVSVGEGAFACRDCLRARLDATSVATWRLSRPGNSLPWGKVAG